MVVVVHPHFAANWTKQAVDAFNSQLAKLDNRFEQPEHKRASPPAEVR